MSKLETSIYRKTTDRNTIIHVSSFHPDHTIKNMPYGQILRQKGYVAVKKIMKLKYMKCLNILDEEGMMKHL